MTRIWRGLVKSYYLVKYYITTKISQLYLFLWGAKVGNDFISHGIPYVVNYGNIIIGNNVKINSCDKANPIGGNIRTYFQVLSGSLIIGNNVRLSNAAISVKCNVTIEDNVMIGAGCKIYDTDFHPTNSIYRYGKFRDNTKVSSKSILIKQGAFIGGQCIILKGITIGANAIIGAGSVVTRDIPDGEIWAGNPVAFIRKSENVWKEK